MYRVIDVRRSGDRYVGGEPEEGIESLHAFSFGPHYDPDNLRFGAILACNEERLAPGAGFDEHPHSHTEIVTWVVTGELTHRDSSGHESVVRPGDVQRLSSGGGVRHVERNDGVEPLTFVQMWLAPSPRAVTRRTRWCTASRTPPLRRPRGGRHAARPAPGGGRARRGAGRPHVYVHVVQGEVRLGDTELADGDAARITAETDLEVLATTETQLLIWEMGD